MWLSHDFIFLVRQSHANDAEKRASDILGNTLIVTSAHGECAEVVTWLASCFYLLVKRM